MKDVACSWVSQLHQPQCHRQRVASPRVSVAGLKNRMERRGDVGQFQPKLGPDTGKKELTMEKPIGLWKVVLAKMKLYYILYVYIHLRQINQRLAEVELSNVIIDCTSTMVTVLVSQWRIAASWRNRLIQAHFKGLDVLVPLLGHHVSAEQSSKRFQPTVFHLNYPPKISTGILLKTWEILFMEGIPNNHLGYIKPCK